MKLKEFFGRVHLKNPKKASRLASLSIWSVLVWFLLVVVFAAIKDINKEDVGVAGVVLLFIVLMVPIIGFFRLFYLAFNSNIWSRELPEYWIAEAEEIIKKKDKNLMERFYSLKLGILVKECKEKKPDAFDELKKFVLEIRRYQSLKTRRKELQGAIRLLKEEESEIVSEAKTLFQKQG